MRSGAYRGCGDDGKIGKHQPITAPALSAVQVSKVEHSTQKARIIGVQSIVLISLFYRREDDLMTMAVFSEFFRIFD